MVSEENASQEVVSQQEQSTPSPGALLKERREQLGLSQQDIAGKLFLKPFQINDLENDVIDDKSSVTFTKGYVRNYAKQLGLPSDEVIEAFERYHKQSEVPSSDKLQSFSKRVAKQTHDDRWMMVTYIILLIIIGGVVIWWYQQPGDSAATDASLIESVKDEAIAKARSPESETSFSGNTTSDNTSVGGNSTISAPSSAPSSALSNTPSNLANRDGLEGGSISAPPSEINDSNNLTALVSSMTEDEDVDLNLNETATPISMTFTFSEDCWVNIADATGEIIATGVKQQGRVLDIQGIPPVAVTLGAPDNVRISVNGELADITSFQNGKIARFTLPL
ncbi:RodZ domain-containing protein [Alteromonas sp. BMJM2]|uniref:RodZ domain-containing protein n=1 Tax=Alteromonas sp. BMJM2 TaxID=2954241 RepID=UPI0022B3EA34|nr:RodZ domain-containing protein [Alteromonas sp. BMJM2]